jgi:CubicO group peptidase (beta-lactamase class C family)
LITFRGLAPILSAIYFVFSLQLAMTGNSATIAGGHSSSDSTAEKTLSMFTGDLFDNFRSSQRYGKTSVVPIGTVKPLPSAQKPLSFSADLIGKSTDLESFLKVSNTSSFLILKDGNIIYERYLHGDSVESVHMSFSIAKSFVSAMVGVAVEEGDIASIDDPIKKYLPELTSATFNGVTIKHILQMASGVAFNEDYTDANSDINKMVAAVQTMSFLDYINTLGRAHEPGSYNHYASINPQLLGILLIRATGMSLTAYTAEKIWKPLGMEHIGMWSLDNEGFELAMGGLAATARDYARLGLLYLNKGKSDTQQVLPASWVRDSVIPDEPHLMPGDNPNSSSTFGYQYQWWMPPEYDGDFLARGIWGQNIYVHPANRVVIVKLAADPKNFQAEYNQAYVEYIQDLAQSLSDR